MANSTVQKRTGPVTYISAAVTEADTGTTVLAIEIPAGSFIPPYGVQIYIPEVFAGGTPLLDVGDGADINGWIIQTEITATTIGTYAGIAAAYAVAGKYYSAADTIDVVVSAALSGGTGYVVVQVYDLSAVDLAAS